VIPIHKTRSRYYVHFRVVDRPGVMGKLATVLGEHSVSIASLIQKEACANGDVPVLMLTHNTIEERFTAAVKEIEELSFVRKPSCYFRVED
jgi:homoserine dehydrogenase